MLSAWPRSRNGCPGGEGGFGSGPLTGPPFADDGLCRCCCWRLLGGSLGFGQEGAGSVEHCHDVVAIGVGWHLDADPAPAWKFLDLYGQVLDSCQLVVVTGQLGGRLAGQRDPGRHLLLAV